MLDAQQITLRFLETKLQVHPDVVRYIQEQNEIGPNRAYNRTGSRGDHRSFSKTHPRHECHAGWNALPVRSIC